MITLDAVCKTYNEGRANEVRAVRDISLSLSLGETCVFRGPSGSGKTTLLSLIGCLSRPSEGRIHLDGTLISSLPEAFMADIRRRRFGFVFQRFNLIRGLSVLDNVLAPALPLGLPHAQRMHRAMTLLAEFQLEHRAKTPSELLSGGEAQRVAIVRALINDPEILIADEPTANLDTALGQTFLSIMTELKRAGKTILMTSHDPRVWSAPLVDRIITMEDGAITAFETPEERVGA